ncbi:MAG: LUD domain-containing protein [Betaproteobacteria bacterium]|nr:LUD domain-containing protein [Betaproteobacteria bacterium]
MKDDRELVLERVQSALAASPHRSPAPDRPAPPAAEASGRGDVGERFVKMVQENGCASVRVENLNEAPAAAAAYLRERDLPQQAAIVESKITALPWTGAGIKAIENPSKDEPVTITGAIAAIAETGQIALAAASQESLASLLARTHIVLIEETAICPSLDNLAEIIDRQPSGIILIAGPSRTADIEQTIVLGAHGPQAMLVIVAGGD